MISPQADNYTAEAGQTLRVGSRFIEIVTSGGLWTATVPHVYFDIGTPSVFSLKPYLTSETNSRMTRLSVAAGYSLPDGVTLDADGHRLIYDGVGDGGNVSTRLVADDDPVSENGYGIGIWNLVEDGSGATYQRVMKLDDASADFMSWNNPRGDWTDSAGTPQGTSPFASTVITDTDTEKLVTWDVTSLVQEWDTNASRPCAMLLKYAGGDTVRFRSRQNADSAVHPILAVTYDDTSTSLIVPFSDVTLDGSAQIAVGLVDELRVSGGSTVVMQWHRPDVVKRRVVSAELRMVCYTQHNNTTVQVMQLTFPVNRILPAVQSGIAAGYAGDSGIIAHPSVLHVQNWDSPTWAADDAWYLHAGSDMVSTGVTSDVPSGHMVTVKVDAGRAGGHAFTKYFGDGYEELYMRYYMRLRNYPRGVTLGGKLPGLSGHTELDYDVNRPDNPMFHVEPRALANGGTGTGYGTRGWSCRGGYDKSTAIGTPMYARTGLHSYLYHANTAVYGTTFPWTKDKLDISFLQDGRWYCIEQHVKMNTANPGEAALSDGVLEAWVDGMLVMQATNVKYRADRDTWLTPMSIAKAWFDHTHGGIGNTAETTYADFAHCVIATEYIGKFA